MVSLGKTEEPVAGRKLLVLDTSYTLEDIKKRGLLSSVTCRDLDGYFSHVWTVHPFATLVTTAEWTPKYGKPVSHELNIAHTFIEGKVGRYQWLKFIFPLNFLIGQYQLFKMLKKLVRHEKINVIRAGDPLYNGLFAWWLAKACKIPFLVRVGGNNDKVYQSTGQPIQKRLFFNRSIEKKVEQFVFSRADMVAGANKDNLDFALRNGASAGKSTIFRYGNLLHPDHFMHPESRKDATGLLQEIGVDSGKFLLYIGRLEKVKHADHVIICLSYLLQKGHDVKAVMVGDGSMLPHLKDMAAQMGIEDAVVFTGNKSQDWLSAIIPHAGIVMSPHTGRALSEAALGIVPVVAYDIDWQAEIIENEVTGLLVPYNDQLAFNEAAERLFNDRPLAQTLALALRERAINMLDPEKLNLHEQNTYEMLIAKQSQA